MLTFLKELSLIGITLEKHEMQRIQTSRLAIITSRLKPQIQMEFGAIVQPH